VHQEASSSLRCKSSSHLKLAFVGLLCSTAPGANSYSFSSSPFLHWAPMPHYTLFLSFCIAELLPLSGPIRSLVPPQLSQCWVGETWFGAKASNCSSVYLSLYLLSQMQCYLEKRKNRQA
jgi:hypothetical protein